MTTKEERETLRRTRTILVTREGRCRFCGQWTTGTTSRHTTLARLASNEPMCDGKPKGPYRVGVGITRNGFNPDTYPLTADEKRRYAGVVANLTATIKNQQGWRLEAKVDA